MSGIVIIDYGMGNLRSVQKAFEHIGVNAVVSGEPDLLASADKVVLPGVGAVADAMDELRRRGLIDIIKQTVRQDKPFLGICLGFQLLFDWSEENGGVRGLGIFSGKIKRFQLPKEFTVPHLGWNQIHFQKDLSLYRGIKDGENVYFVHSYYADPTDSSLAATVTDYGIDFCSSISIGNVNGVQFHPEKSQQAGLKILKNFAEL